MPDAMVISRTRGSMYVTYRTDPVWIAPPNTYTSISMMATGMIAVVMMVSGLRVTCRMVRPVRTVVSSRKCVAIVFPLLLVRARRAGTVVLAGAVVLAGPGVLAGTADDREEDVFEGGLLLDVLDLGGRQQLLEFGQGAVDDDPAVVEDRDPVGQLLGLVQVLGGEQHRRAARGEFPDGLPHLGACLRVQPGRRLVEEDDRRIPDEAHRDVEPAAHAAGVRRCPPGARPGQREAPQQVIRFSAGVLEVPQPGDEDEVLPPAEDLIDGRELPGEADGLTGVGGPRRDVEAVDPSGP